MPARAAVPAVLALLAVLCALSAACAATGGRPAERELTLVLLKTGPQSGALSQEDTKQLFAGHFSNMERLAEERQLLLAGPFGQVRHDDTLRGLFVLDTDRALGHDQQRQVVRLLANTAFDVTTAGDAHGYIRVRPP